MEDQTKTKTTSEREAFRDAQANLHLLDDPHTQQKIVTPGEHHLGQIWASNSRRTHCETWSHRNRRQPVRSVVHQDISIELQILNDCATIFGHKQRMRSKIRLSGRSEAESRNT